ncbi:hypothetical protein [Streptomyces sp. SLBN-134]|uniref:hypothetical protein n=1 Tax=Streptomyces sp. SLBN-134 TaxID=2768456 RepID=UPI00115048B1|nr:hypothetical protein [Streptomyces sp. SLBN-134]TQL22456.1 hypothetical protein FBY37_4492 [Streptomyces sp. SLBN-134]
MNLRAPRRPRLHAHWPSTRHHDSTAAPKRGSDVSLRAPRRSRLHTLCAPARHRTGGGHHEIAVAHTGGE